MSTFGVVKFILLILLVSLNRRVACRQRQRSDDAEPLQAVVERLTGDFQALQAEVISQKTQLASQEARIAQLEAENQRRVAFSANIPEGHNIAASVNAIVTFTNIITNVGNAYNPSTSVFTCPYDGDYFFALSVDVSHDYGFLSLRKNGHGVVWADHDDTVSTHLSATVVMSLSTGDVVTVNQGSSTGHIDYGADCTFTGFLVR